MHNNPQNLLDKNTKADNPKAKGPSGSPEPQQTDHNGKPKIKKQMIIYTLFPNITTK